MKSKIVEILLEIHDTKQVEILNFIDESLIGEVILKGHRFNSISAVVLYEFEFDEDAVAFKLRWT